MSARTILLAPGRGVQQGGGALLVDAHDAERRLEATGRIERHPVEAREMRRPDKDGHVDRVAAKLLVRVGCNGTRIDKAGMGRDDGERDWSGRWGR